MHTICGTKNVCGQSCRRFSLNSKAGARQSVSTTGTQTLRIAQVTLGAHHHTGILSALRGSTGTCSLKLFADNGQVEHTTNHRVCEPPITRAGSLMVRHLLSSAPNVMLAHRTGQCTPSRSAGTRCFDDTERWCADPPRRAGQ